MTVMTPVREHVEPSLLKDCGIAFLASLIVALFAHVSLPLFFTPVPLSFQPHVVLLMSAVLGRRRASLMVLAFLTEGLMGLPVFANGFTGPAVFFGPTGGYLIGYLLAAYFTGYLMEQESVKTPLKAFYHMGLGSLVILTVGTLYLASFVGFQSAMMLGFLPFLAGDVVKLILSVKTLKYMKVVR